MTLSNGDVCTCRYVMSLFCQIRERDSDVCWAACDNTMYANMGGLVDAS